ncbi:DNA/RNA non-specific endonuclease [Enterococcus saccharolyticus]|uniref:DNA/RNA non-specific endonuclease n=1 Tax=Enterococcus saccharolyticus TaxID=41997 RepID=UPI001E2CDB61|nr:DNA/RNA non-specific endonuclease [Enterococcus saccharolyticus]MCD5002953.1 DNA/RNA non-specific endonuclease [Enterococcus saccharolyticus]
MENLFVILFLVSLGGLGYGTVRSIIHLIKKDKQRRKDNKRLIISSALALVISFVGVGITAPSPPADVKESTTVSSKQEDTKKVENDKKKQEALKKEQEQNNQELKKLRTELATIEYKDTQTIEVNDNVPLFTKADLSVKKGSWETYGDLDELNRATSAEAMLNHDLMPTEKRGDISNVEPTGWKNKKLNKGYLYNRSHLIGFALSGENDNWKNLITGTAQLNNPEMLRHEMDIKTYLEENDDHYVRYSVTPIFKDDELLARGVHLMAQSVNDDTIKFNVFIFNIQDGVTLNYADGSSETDEEKAAKKQKEEQRIADEKAKAEQEKQRIADEEAKAEQEKQRIADEEAKAEQERQRIAAERAEQERIEAEQAEANRLAEEQAAQQQSAANNPYSDANGNGLIKGSSSGIYHVPGSTYYDRTTNPVAWFSSIEEAEAAGYRPPKR